MQLQSKYVLFFGNHIRISETIVVQWLIMIFLIAMSLYLTRDLKKVPNTKRQVVLELAVTSLKNLVTEMMGEKFVKKVPDVVSYIGTLFLFFICSNFVTLLGLRSPTTDLDTTFAWAIITFGMVYYFGIKFNGAKGYLKEFIEPTPLMAPLHIIGELAKPISLSFRPFGNILGGSIIMALLYKLLGYLSTLIPNLTIPIGQFAIPVPLHIYFDLFEGALQAFIFIMLTMAFVGIAAGTDE